MSDVPDLILASSLTLSKNVQPLGLVFFTLKMDPVPSILLRSRGGGHRCQRARKQALPGEVGKRMALQPGRGRGSWQGKQGKEGRGVRGAEPLDEGGI